jgi:hypothetical protein
MAKRGRIATPVHLIQEHQCIELDNQLIIRISRIEQVNLIRKDAYRPHKGGYMLYTYADRIALFFEDEALVDLVDESTLTHVPFD